MSVFIAIKAVKGLKSLEHLDKSYSEKNEKFFNITGKERDKKLVASLTDDKYYPVFFLVFNDTDDYNVERIYLSTGKKNVDDKGVSLKVQVSRIIDWQPAIKNFLSCSELDLSYDYETSSYVCIEKSPSLVKQMYFIMYNSNNSYDANSKTKYKVLAEENELHPLAQRNENCIREHQNSERLYNYGEFQNDYNNIVKSKAFRRMVDKAQLFSSDKGDHYRTRMTHSLMVAQIARSISRELKLNSFLTEAIALGHDLGHTPFGHQGERTLDLILNVKSAQMQTQLKDNNYGGFKHNYHSLRIATRLEKIYLGFDGLNLSYQTLDGIWKHTKTEKTGLELDQYVSSKDLQEYLNSVKEIPCTLEGQVVMVADEIAQRGHDIEDAFVANRLSVDELKSYLLLDKMSELKNKIEHVEKLFSDLIENGSFLVDADALLKEQISSVIIEFFIDNVLRQSRENIDAYKTVDAEPKITKKLVDFSPDGKKLCEYLEKIISKKVTNSTEVSLFDWNGSNIVEFLFSSYYENPCLLHSGTLQRILQDFRSITCNVIDFEEGDPKIISDEWKKITSLTMGEKDPEIINEYCEKNRILVRNIVDFIAGMTDSYAINEYNKIKRR